MNSQQNWTLVKDEVPIVISEKYTVITKILQNLFM